MMFTKRLDTKADTFSEKFSKLSFRKWDLSQLILW